MRFLLPFCCLLLCSAFAVADRPVIRVAATASTLPPIPPIVWYDRCKKQPTGSYWHLVFRALKELGYQPVWADIDYPANLDNYLLWQKHLFKVMPEGAADIAVFSALIEESTLIAGTSPVSVFNEVMTVSKLLPKPSSIRELAPYHGGMLPSAADNLHKLSDDLILQYDTFRSVPELFEALSNDEIDYTITSNKLAKVFIRKEKLTDRVHVIDLGVITLKLVTGMPDTPENRQLIKRIDERLAHYQNENLISRVENSYMKKWLTYEDCEPE